MWPWCLHVNCFTANPSFNLRIVLNVDNPLYPIYPYNTIFQNPKKLFPRCISECPSIRPLKKNYTNTSAVVLKRRTKHWYRWQTTWCRSTSKFSKFCRYFPTSDTNTVKGVLDILAFSENSVLMTSEIPLGRSYTLITVKATFLGASKWSTPSKMGQNEYSNCQDSED